VLDNQRKVDMSAVCMYSVHVVNCWYKCLQLKTWQCVVLLQ